MMIAPRLARSSVLWVKRLAVGMLLSMFAVEQMEARSPGMGWEAAQPVWMEMEGLGTQSQSGSTSSKTSTQDTQSQPAQTNSQTTNTQGAQGPYPPSYSRGNPKSSSPPASSSGGTVPASRTPSSKSGHGTDTNQGSEPHGGGNGGAIAGAAAGAVVGGLLLHELMSHHAPSPEKLGHDGPETPKDYDMSNFTVKGLVGPNWPVVLDFKLETAGTVEIDIVAADKHEFHVMMTNSTNRRAYGITRLPPGFGTEVQAAIFQIHTLAPTGSAAPGMRTYGLGAGERAVGSVAIDKVVFGPAAIHPKAKEVATYSFHAHSAFSGVRAEFIFTTLYNGHVLLEKDSEEGLPPVPPDEQARGTWPGKGKPGQHMLEIRAWRGLKDGGDWVVAWSPDIVDVVK